MGLTITLAGQDITDFVDESSIHIESVLGQGAGSGSGVGSDSTATFLSDLGPPKTALGAGQTIPPVTRNLFSANQSAHENVPDLAEWGPGIAYVRNLGVAGSITRDTTKAWQGGSSLKVVLDGANAFQALSINIPASEITPGAVYTISAYTLATAGQTPDLRFFIEGNDGIAGNHALSATNVHATPVSGQWTRYQITATMPAVIVDSYIGLRLDTPTAQAITFWIDGLQFEQFPGATDWHLGRTTQVPRLVRLGEVIVKDATNTTIFGGYVTDMNDASLPVTIKTELDCVDYFQFLERTEVNEVYTGKTDIFIIRDIITKYAPDISLADIPATGTYTFAKRYIRAKSVKEALQAIANTTGYAIWVTPDKKLEYKAPTDVSTAPFSLSDAPNFVSSFGYDITQYTLDENGTINRVYFYGGKKSSDDFIQDLSPQANGVNKVFQLLYYPHDTGDGAVHVKNGATELAVGSPFSTAPNDKLKSQGGTKDVLLNRDSHTLTYDVAPTVANNPTAIYRYSTPLVVVVSDRSSFQFYGKWLDTKMDDQTVQDASTAIQRARVLLSQQSYGLESIEAVTLKGGLQAGMLLRVTNALRAIDDTYLIQKVTTTPLGSGFFEYAVSLGAWNWNLVDLLFAVAKRAGVQDDATEEDVSVVQAQETLEASTLAIVINLTTKASGTYYSGNFYSGFATVTS